VEVGQEAQSMERNDLQLITIENPSEVPEWVTPFHSAQLRSLLAAAISPSQSGNWWFAPSISTPTPGQLFLPSATYASAIEPSIVTYSAHSASKYTIVFQLGTSTHIA
jgi:hypothetical protein